VTKTELTIAEAAAVLHLTPRQVRYHFARGHLPGRYVTGRLVLLDAAAVRAFVPEPVGNPGWRRKKARKINLK
jgi:excisionase family DNA binding protein